MIGQVVAVFGGAAWMAGDVIRWFPLDRIPELEAAIAGELASRRRTTRRDACGVALGLHGLRVGEVVRAKTRDLFAAGAVLEVPPFKRGRGRRIRLHASLLAALQAEIADRTAKSDRLLCNCRGGPVSHTQLQAMADRIFQRLLGQAHGLTFHSLRHTFAMRLYAETRDLFLVQSKLGHRSVKSTEVYARSLADVPDSCLVNVASGVIQPGQQLRLFSA